MVGNLVHGVLTVFGDLLGSAMEVLNNAADSVSAVDETEDVAADARRKRFAGSK